MNHYEIFNETEENIDIKEVKNFLNFVLKKEKLQKIIFNIIFVNNQTIHQINKEYRNIDKPTDVISFALEDNETIEFEFGRLLGDIYISVDKIKSQANEYGHSEKREMLFLIIHGLLHLLGYDHITKEEEKVMFTKQELILNEYKQTKNSQKVNK